MLFRVLGPVDVLDDGGAPVRLGGSDQRRLLAALLAHLGAPLPAAALVDLLWGELPPPGAERLLAVAVSRLRQALAGAAARSGSATLRSTAAGYELHIDRDACDATRFEDLVDRGRALLADGDPRPALRLLQEGLGLWRGRAFQDVELDGHGRDVADRLEEARLSARETLATWERDAASRNTLPAPATSFVGRDGEPALLLGVLRRTRLLTLTGPGGVGKTRLAVELGRLLASTTPGVVALVDLAHAETEADLLAAVATALGGKEGVSDDLLTVVATAVGAAPSVLVLDGCERLVEACARVVPRLLEACPELTVVVTSRVALDVPEEAGYVVRPLPLPDVEARPPAVRVSPAVQLFWDRAIAVRPDLEPDEDSRRAVEEICRRVDGLPLAVELAASLVQTLTPEAIAAHQRRRRTLPDAAAAAQREPRATLSGLVEWSAELLAPEAGRLLDGLSVFSGGFSADAAAAVLAGRAGDRAALRPLQQLVRGSLVSVEHGADGSRYRLLETVRVFAATRLEASGEAEAWKDRHAAYFLDLAETATRQLKGPDQATWLLTLRREEDNLRAALAHLADRDDADRECRLAVALWRPCYLTGQYTQGRAWLRQALRHTEVEPALRAAMLSACGALALYQCDYRPAGRYCDRAARLYADVGDAAGRAEALTLLGSIAREQADYPRALRLHAEAAGIFSSLGDRWGVAHSMELEAFARWLSADLDGSAAVATEARRLALEVGDEERAAWTQLDLGAAALYRGDLASAGTLLGDALAAFEALGFAEGQGWSHNLLAVRSAELGDHASALVSLGLALRSHRDVGDRWRICSVLEAVVRSATALGLASQAAPLLGMAERLRDELGTPAPPCEASARAEAVRTVRAELGEARLARARRRGETWSLDRACSEALALRVRIQPSVGGPADAAGRSSRHVSGRQRLM